MKRLFAIVSIVSPLVLAQVPPATGIRMPVEIPAGPQNLDFQAGNEGSVPVGWFVPGQLRAAGYGAELSKDGCLSGICVAVTTPPAGGPKPKGQPTGTRFGNLMQTFDARKFRGKTIRLTASLRLDASSHDDTAQMWLRVDCELGRACGFDNMQNRPVRSSKWKKAEIKVHVPESAVTVNIGFLTLGHGRAWVDEVAMESLPK